jgi:hypothetical protein
MGLGKLFSKMCETRKIYIKCLALMYMGSVCRSHKRTGFCTLILSEAYNQGRTESLRGPRPVFSAEPQSTEKCGGVWVCFRRFIIYVMSKCLCKSHLFFLS